MSILFPKVRKPREWDYRPIYYDKDKEARKEKLARLQHGDLRKEHEKNMQRNKAHHKSKLIFWIALLAMLLFVYSFFN